MYVVIQHGRENLLLLLLYIIYCVYVICRWQKITDNRQVLMESNDISIKRINFLRKMQEYRRENRNIFYIDETYIHSSHTQQKAGMMTHFKGLKNLLQKDAD